MASSELVHPGVSATLLCRYPSFSSAIRHYTIVLRGLPTAISQATDTHTYKKPYRYMPQATGSTLPGNRHTPITNMPIHSTSHRQLGRLLSVACGMYRYVFYRCVSVAWVVASFCLQSRSIFSSRLFSSFLVYSLISYSSIFEYGRLPVECVGMFFIGVCRGLGRLLSVSCGMYRYVFLSVCVGGLGDCPVLLTITVCLLFSSVLFLSRIFFNILF